jgi:hypothetical protein
MGSGGILIHSGALNGTNSTLRVVTNKKVNHERILPYVEENHCSVQTSCSGKNVHTAPAGVLLSTGITL